MTDFTCDINIKDTSTENRLEFDIKGNDEYGLDKTIVNAIRRTLLSSIETYAFRTSYENPDITIEVNNANNEIVGIIYDIDNNIILERITR